MFSAVVHKITAPHSVASALATDGDREVEETWAVARPRPGVPAAGVSLVRGAG